MNTQERRSGRAGVLALVLGLGLGLAPLQAGGILGGKGGGISLPPVQLPPVSPPPVKLPPVQLPPPPPVGNPVKEASKAIGKAAGNLGNSVGKPIQESRKSIKGGLQSVGKQAVSGTKDLAKQGQQLGQQAAGISKTIGQQTGTVLQGASKQAGNVGKQVLGGAKDLGQQASKQGAQLGKQVVGGAKDLKQQGQPLGKIGGAIQGAGKPGLAKVPDLGKQASDSVKNLGKQAGNTGKQVLDGLAKLDQQRLEAMRKIGLGKRSDRKAEILDENGQVIGWKNLRTGEVQYDPAYVRQKQADEAQDRRDQAEIAALEEELRKLEMENQRLENELSGQTSNQSTGLSLKKKKDEDTTDFTGPETEIRPGKPPKERPPKDKPPRDRQQPPTTTEIPATNTESNGGSSHPPFRPRQGPSKRHVEAEQRKDRLKVRIRSERERNRKLREKARTARANNTTANPAGKTIAARVRNDRELTAAIEQEARKARHVSAHDLKVFAAIESGYDRNQGINSSGFAGIFQMGRSAAQDVGVNYRDIDEPREWRKNVQAGVAYVDLNAGRLKKDGFTATPLNLYLYHNQGPGGAKTLLRNVQSGQARKLPATGNMLNNMPESLKQSIRKSGRTITQQDFYDYEKKTVERIDQLVRASE